MSLLEGLILGVVQGLTEFLPVSSSGHLTLTLALMGRQETQEMSFLIAILHLASAAAIIVYFWRDLLLLFTSRRKELAWIILASIPAAVVGLLFKDLIEETFAMPWLVGVLLILTGGILAIADRMQGSLEMPEGGPLRALAIGVAQALAILPGFSRSGLTISTGLFTGIDRPHAFRFSFLLGIPVILGAGGLKILDGIEQGVDIAALPLIVSLIVTFALSLGAIYLFRILLTKRRLIWFSGYCVVVGVTALIVLAL